MSTALRHLFDAMKAMAFLVVAGTLVPSVQRSPGGRVALAVLPPTTSEPPQSHGASESPVPVKASGANLAAWSKVFQGLIEAEAATIPDVPSPSSETESRRGPVRVALDSHQNPSIGFASIEADQTSPPPLPAQVLPPGQFSSSQPETSQPDPYIRRPPILEPVCTPSRYEIAQYWRLDVIRMRHLVGRADEACLRRTFGKTDKPVLKAVGSGANTANLPAPPEDYAEVIRQRGLGSQNCGNGGIIPAPSE